VKQVAGVLANKGLKVFYDEFFESQLWGKDLADYLRRVYSLKSTYCIVFYSIDYERKMWPSFERRCANYKDIEQFGGYILPVVFKGANIRGLDPSRGYLSAETHTPNQIAEIFIKKFEEDKIL
jgi:hypothetical protein